MVSLTVNDNKKDPGEIGRKAINNLPADTLAYIIGLGADIVFLLDPRGYISHCSHKNTEILSCYDFTSYIGNQFRDCVTLESCPKVDAMLGAKDTEHSRTFQINHRIPGQPDLPVLYNAYFKESSDFIVLAGSELRQQMLDQQRLIETQTALESDYHDLRRAESRYRTAFKLSETAEILLEGEKKRVLEANAAAVRLLTDGHGGLVNSTARDLVSKRDRDRFADAIAEARFSGKYVILDDISSAKGKPIRAGIRAYREDATTNLILSIWPMQDQSALPVIANTVSDTQPLLDLDLLPEAAVRTDEEGNIVSANALFLDLIKAPTLNQVIDHNARNWLGKSGNDVDKLYGRVIGEGYVSAQSASLNDAIGDEHDVLISARYDKATGTVQVLMRPQRDAARSPGAREDVSLDQAEDFASLVGRVPLKELVRESLDVVEKICIEAALDKTNNNRVNAAEILGVSRQSLYIKLRRHGLENYRPRA